MSKIKPLKSNLFRKEVPMETIEIKTRIKGVVADMFDLKPEDISEEKAFNQIAKYDSMRALEYLAKLETEFNIVIDPDMLQKMMNVEKTAEALAGLIHA